MGTWKSRVNILQYIDDESLTYYDPARLVVDALTDAQGEFDFPLFPWVVLMLGASAENSDWDTFNDFLELVYAAGDCCRIRLS